MDIQALEARIKEIEAVREKFVNEANQQIGAYAGAIAELKLWIDIAQKEAAEEQEKESVTETLDRLDKLALDVNANGNSSLHQEREIS